MTTLADRIRDGATGYSADMAKAMGWKRRSGNIKLFSNGGMVASPPQHPWLSPDGTRHASCPDYEDNPRHAFDECEWRGWFWSKVWEPDDIAIVSIVSADHADMLAYVKSTGDDTRAINEALCRAVGV